MKPIDELLATKSFADLSAEERQFVLKTYTKEAYEQDYEVVQKSQAHFKTESASIKAPAAPPLAALQALKAHQPKKKKGVFFLFAHKIPTWSAAAVFLLLFALYQLGTKNTISPIAAAPVVDTVFVEKTITEYIPAEPDTIVEVVYRDRPVIVQEQPCQQDDYSVAEPDSYSDEILNLDGVNYTTLFSTINQGQGVSLKDDSLTQMVGRLVF